MCYVILVILVNGKELLKYLKSINFMIDKIINVIIKQLMIPVTLWILQILHL